MDAEIDLISAENKFSDSKDKKPPVSLKSNLTQPIF
jgi:hypothetical protein